MSLAEKPGRYKSYKKKIRNYAFAEVCVLFSSIETVGWLNTDFDASVSFTFASKNLDPLVAKNGRKEVNNTDFHFLIIKLTYVSLPWQHNNI